MTQLELLFFPSALILIFEILIVLWFVNLAVKKWLGVKELPILAGLLEGLFPTVALFWAFILLLIFLTDWQFLPVVGIWATVTTIMLWPVGSNFGISYFNYRKPLFILGVLSMAALPVLGFALQYLPKGDLARTWWLLAVVAILTIFSIVAGVKKAVGQSLPMFFRPDILFGDGRVLATGVISLGLAMRFLFGGMFPIPKGNWYGLLFAIVFGIIQIIPLRGMFKLQLRMGRMIENRLSGWFWVFLRESWFLFASLLILYGFHNVLMGTTPIIDWTLPGLNPEHFATMGKPGLILMAVAAAFFIFIRGGYKKLACGDPFIRERLSQSVIKSILFLTGFLPFIYGFVHIMEAHGGAFPRPFPEGLSLTVGLGLLIWGILMVGPIRIVIQRVQRHALVAQMAAILLPAMPAPIRKRMLEQVVHALADMEEKERIDHMRSMQEAIMAAPKETQRLMTQARMEVVSEIPTDKRRKILGAMDKVMFATR